MIDPYGNPQPDQDLRGGLGEVVANWVAWDYFFWQSLDPAGTIHPLTTMVEMPLRMVSPRLASRLVVNRFSNKTVSAVMDEYGAIFAKHHADYRARGAVRNFFSSEGMFSSGMTRGQLTRRANQIATRKTLEEVSGKGWFSLGREAGVARAAEKAVARHAGAAAGKRAFLRTAATGLARSAFSTIATALIAIDVAKSAYHAAAGTLALDREVTIQAGQLEFTTNSGLAIAGDFTRQLSTERQRAMEEIGRSRMNARSAIGFEASLLH